MRFLHSLIPSILLVGAGVAEAAKAATWGFDEAVISVTGKGGAGSAFKDKLSASTLLAKSVTLGATDALKIILSATEDGKAKRPHQAFLLLKDQDTGLEATFPLSMKENGKGKVDFTQKDLPFQLLTSTKPLHATLILASFGTTQGFSNHVFNLDVKLDANVPLPKYDAPLRYGQKEEINHIFKADPKSGPKIISLFFVLAVLATVPALFGAWAYLGANLSHLSKAIGAAPVSHSLFIGSILSMEGIFFLYYYNWNLFKTLPIAGVVSLVAFLSGSKALSEVQSRRLAGER
ncbi:related to oligosaccharyltransferase delta subunit (ribophorin II) [Rhynchosporium agropyri]|uniref:Related to oligosaccharyltransferase delta subunit (Ribophorin II) n=1 Tax=Rhynchosporium agropyri TaxID=914238 RepID=A0A1E1LK73_9HELO|nr:related to oligosaccharyltransferase delta subunit (ribophorin II) [Rhynchosporium agropyri]